MNIYTSATKRGGSASIYGGKSANSNLGRQYTPDRRSDRESILLRKEVIQPHLPVRLPCYDLALLTGLTLGVFSLAVR